MKRYRPSNGSEGMDFMARFCERCKHDAAYQADPESGDGCPIVAATVILLADDPDYPHQWTYNADGEPVCTAFEEIGKDGE